jgi:hypothetical protein
MGHEWGGTLAQLLIAVVVVITAAAPTTMSNGAVQIECDNCHARLDTWNGFNSHRQQKRNCASAKGNEIPIRASDKRPRKGAQPASPEVEMGGGDVEMGDGDGSQGEDVHRALANQRELHRRVGGGRWESEDDFNQWRQNHAYQVWEGQEWIDFADWRWTELALQDQQDSNIHKRGVWSEEEFAECIKAAEDGTKMQARHWSGLMLAEWRRRGVLQELLQFACGKMRAESQELSHDPSTHGRKWYLDLTLPGGGCGRRLGEISEWVSDDDNGDKEWFLIEPLLTASGMFENSSQAAVAMLLVQSDMSDGSANKLLKLLAHKEFVAGDVKKGSMAALFKQLRDGPGNIKIRQLNFTQSYDKRSVKGWAVEAHKAVMQVN